MLTRRSFLGSVAALYAVAKNQVLGTGHREFHVAVHGNDAHDGTLSRPFRTISAAAVRAQPGDVITVHEGIYRRGSHRREAAPQMRIGSFTRLRPASEW